MADELQPEQRTRAVRQSAPVDSTVGALCRYNNVCSPSPTVRESSLVQVVREFVGYASVWWAQVLYIVLILLSLGLIWVLGLYHIDAKLWRFRRCALGKAKFVSVQVQMFTRTLLTNVQPFTCIQLLLAVHHWTPDTCAGA